MNVTGKRYFPMVSYAVQSRGPVPSGLMLDNGPALLSSYLLNEGYTPIVFDFNNLKVIEDIAKRGKETFIKERIDFLDDYYKSNSVKIAGTKLYANGFIDNVRIHEELKRRNPDLILVAGGPHVDWFGDEIFNYTDAFDMMTYGDGDSAIVPLAKLAYDNGRIEDIPNLIYRKDGQTIRTKRREISLDNLPRPAYDEEYYPGLEGKLHIVPIEDSRGCSYGRCGFCVHTRIAGKRRVRPIEQLVSEIDDYGMRVSRLSGPSPMPEYISELIKRIPGRKISAFTYSFPGYDYAEIAKGLMGAFIGLEATDKHILENVLRKTDNTEQYLKNASEMVKEFKRHGVATVVAMMVPCPGETQATMERSLEYLVDMQPDFVVTLPMGPIPGTSITRRAKKDSGIAGVHLDEDFDQRWMLYELDLLQRSEEWPTPPFKTNVNGEFVNPFHATMEFTRELVKNGMHPLSDEIVLMSYLYHNGLSPNQNDRRMQCNEFMASSRSDIATGNVEALAEKVRTMNRNQLIDINLMQTSSASCCF
ncbi:MAG: B12-binding domain-containing radical SAM protein [Planctomycetes bacterium]|nr:B12-binding domain-containing radical SAM protein [Planctomycetota bacterium]